MKTKKILSVLLVLALLVACLTACAGSSGTSSAAGDPGASTDTSSTEASKDADDEKYVVGICQLVTHDALDAATEGFKQALIDELGEENVVFLFKDAAGEANTCVTIVNDFVSKDVDLIMANATAALQAAANATMDIPILGTSITEYGVALEISDFNGTVGGNISGTSDLAPLTEQAQMILDLVPEAKTVGMLYCSAEPNSAY